MKRTRPQDMNLPSEIEAADLDGVARALVQYESSPGRVHCVFPSAARGWLKLLTLEDLDRAISVTGVGFEHFQIFCKEWGLGPRKLFDYVDRLTRQGVPIRLLDEVLTNGKSLLIRKMHLRSHGAHAAHAILARHGVDVRDVVAIFSPPCSQATVPHADGHATLQLQVAGTKTWKVWGVVENELIDSAPSVQFLTSLFSNLEEGTSTEVVLGPGDMLFVPKRALHTAESGPEFSLSYSFQLGNGRSSRASIGTAPHPFPVSVFPPRPGR